MSELKLADGKIVLLDEEDYERLKDFKWCLSSKRYAGRFIVKNGKRTGIYMHRVIADPPKGMVVDHVNGNKLDNRRSNLRVCTQYQNVVKQTMNSRNTSGYRGVTYDATRNKWVAQTHKAGKHIFIGRHETKEDAIKAHKSMFDKIHIEP